MRFEELAVRYAGALAHEYDRQRDKGSKWLRENEIVETLLDGIPPGSALIDVPVGTGRFFAAYKRHGLNVTGIDVSPDMLAEARQALQEQEMCAELRRGDIRALPFPDGSFDLALCIRFLNWIHISAVNAVVAELARVSRRDLIIGIRHLTPLRDLRSPGRLRRQLATRWRQRYHRGGLVFHRKGDVDRAFDHNGLQAVVKAVVEQRRDGTDYVIYRLTKRKAI